MITDNENKLKIKLNNSGNLKYHFYDIYGNIFSENGNVTIDNSYFEIDINGLSNGLYFLQIQTSNKTNVMKVLISR